MKFNTPIRTVFVALLASWIGCFAAFAHGPSRGRPPTQRPPAVRKVTKPGAIKTTRRVAKPASRKYAASAKKAAAKVTVRQPVRNVKSKKMIAGAIRAVAPAKRKSGTTVLGHYPLYEKSANRIGARHFKIPDAVWEKARNQPGGMKRLWKANLKFLDRTIKRGDKILMSNHTTIISPDSLLWREIQYLQKKGYFLDHTGRRFVRMKRSSQAGRHRSRLASVSGPTPSGGPLLSSTRMSTLRIT